MVLSFLYFGLSVFALFMSKALYVPPPSSELDSELEEVRDLL